MEIALQRNSGFGIGKQNRKRKIKMYRINNKEPTTKMSGNRKIIFSDSGK